MKKKMAVLLAVVLSLSLVAVGCGGGNGGGSSASGVSVEGNTIKIGVFQPTTGENGGGGMQEVLGTRYANKLNPTVDINGTTYDIELVEVDNQSDKAAAVTAAQSLLSKGVVAVIGSYGSGVSIAAGDTFEQAAVPAMGCSCTNPQVTDGKDYYFRTCFIDPFQGTVMANFAIEEGYKKAAVIIQNGDDYSTGLGGYFKSAFVAAGGEMVAEETYNTNETDFNAILTNVKKAKADVVFIPSSINTATLIIPQIAANGVKAQILAGDTWENASIISKDAVGVKLSTFFDETDKTNPVAAEFVKGFKEYLKSSDKNLNANGGNSTVAAVSALGYDAYMSVYHALESLDGKDIETVNSVAIKDALKTVSFDGVTGSIAFDEKGDAIKDIAYIKTVTEESVKSKEFKFLRTQTIADK